MILNITAEQVTRLHEVFALVKPNFNWKDPIRAAVPKSAATEAEIDEAVVFFAGGHPKVVSVGDQWLVTGAGYYEWVGC